MSAANFKIANNMLHVEGKPPLEFAHKVGEVVEASGVLVVRLSVPVGVAYPRNVFCVAGSGELLWQIADLRPNRDDSPYVGLVALPDAVLANRWDDFHVWLDPWSGRVLKQEWSRS